MPVFSKNPATPAAPSAQPARPRLIACPDCGESVSRRALSCPHCGCPGEAITDAVRAEEMAARPLPLVQVSTDTATGFGVVIEEADATHVLLDGALLAGAQSLTLGTLSKSASVPYSQLMLAADSALVRLTVPPEGVARLPLAERSAASPATTSLDTSGQLYALTSARTANIATVAHLDTTGHVIAVAVSGPGGTTLEPVDVATVWIAAAPGEYRTQSALLRRLGPANRNRPLTPTDREALRTTPWLTPFLQKTAEALLASQPTK